MLYYMHNNYAQNTAFTNSNDKKEGFAGQFYKFVFCNVPCCIVTFFDSQTWTDFLTTFVQRSANDSFYSSAVIPMHGASFYVGRIQMFLRVRTIVFLTILRVFQQKSGI